MADQSSSSSSSDDIRYLLYLTDPESITHGDDIGVIEETWDWEECDEIRLVLDTGGGDAYTAAKIIDVLQSKCDRLKTIIPHRAKSAGTIMVWGSNEVYLPTHGELGPLDKPQEHPGRDGERISSHDSLRSPDLIKDKTKDIMYEMVAELMSEGIDRDKAFEISSNFAINFTKPIMEKKDPDIMYRSHRLQQIGGRLAIDLYFRYNENENKEEVTDTLLNPLEELVTGFPEHGFPIGREKVRDLLEPVEIEVKDAEGLEEWDVIYQIFRANEEQKIIKAVRDLSDIGGEPNAAE